MDKKRYDELMKHAEQAHKDAERYSYLARHYRSVANEFRQQAVELVAPFKRGDVIEVERAPRWKAPVKLVTIKVTSISQYGTGTVEVKGNIVTKKGDLSNKTTYAFIGGDRGDRLVRVVESGKG